MKIDLLYTYMNTVYIIKWTICVLVKYNGEYRLSDSYPSMSIYKYVIFHIRRLRGQQYIHYLASICNSISCGCSWLMNENLLCILPNLSAIFFHMHCILTLHQIVCNFTALFNYSQSHPFVYICLSRHSSGMQSKESPKPSCVCRQFKK